jgi:hypothetical protein
MIVALAGRRIDSPDAKETRFPVENTRLVEQRIRSLFEQQRPQALVCSAASGADLLALEVAGDLQIERQIILPFPAEVFRNTSVVDRPGQWGERFDRVLKDLGPEEQVVSLDYSVRSGTAYVATNQAILERAQLIASKTHEAVLAVVVWNGASRGEQDATLEFRRAATATGLLTRDVSTI